MDIDNYQNINFQLQRFNDIILIMFRMYIIYTMK